MLKISFSETPSEEKWILQGRLTAPWLRELKARWKKKHRRDKQRACIVDLNEIAFIDKSGERLLRLLLKEGAQCIASADYTKHVLEKLTTKGKDSVYDRLAGFFFAAGVGVLAVLIGGTSAKAQNAVVTGSVPSGPASYQVLRLTLRDTINLAVRYNLGSIESGENAQVARSQCLLARSSLLPQISPGVPENKDQGNGTVSLLPLGRKTRFSWK